MNELTRRTVLGAGLGLAALPLRPARADIAKAEAEGEVLFYTHDGEAGAAAVVDGFSKDFPKIKANYVRAQNGALYSKILSERSAGRFGVDVDPVLRDRHRNRLPEARRLRAIRLAATRRLRRRPY